MGQVIKPSDDCEYMPPHVQRYVTRAAIERHNSFDKQDGIHGEVDKDGLSLDVLQVFETLCIAMEESAINFWDRERWKHRLMFVKLLDSCKPTSRLLSLSFASSLPSSISDRLKRSSIFPSIMWRRSSVVISTVLAGLWDTYDRSAPCAISGLCSTMGSVCVSASTPGARCCCTSPRRAESSAWRAVI